MPENKKEAPKRNHWCLLLDTNFLLTAVKNKIHLFEELNNLFGKPEILIPYQVIDELEKIKQDKKTKIKDRESANLALQIIKKSKIINIELKTKEVDSGIIYYLKEHPTVIVATLDRILKAKIKKKNPQTKFLSIRQKKRIFVQ